MATQLNPMIWQEKALSLDCSTVIFDIQNHYHQTALKLNNNVSFLHSQKLKESLLESKKQFLKQSLQDDNKEETQMEEKSLVLNRRQQQQQQQQNDEQRKVPSKKISFKIKKTSSIYRRNVAVQQKMTISANKVAELTKKFNQIIVENRGLLDDAKFKCFVKRVNSDSDKLIVTRTDSTKVTRKPSLKTKTVDKQFKFIKPKPVITKPKPKTVCNNNNGTNGDKYCVRAKICYLETPQKVDDKPSRPTTLNLIKNNTNESKSCTNVRATIEIFERKTQSPTTEQPPKLMPKPKVPNKILKSTETVVKIQQQNDKTDFDDDKVEIINIPAVLPQRRCDSMYETLNLRKILPENIKAKSEETISSTTNIIKPNTSFLWRKSPDNSAKQSPIIENVTTNDCEESIYDAVDVKKIEEEKIYEELNTKEHDYEYCETEYEDVVPKTTTDDGYEYFESLTKENIYETLPPLPCRRQQQEPLPPRPPSGSSYCTGTVSNCYESIYNPDTNVKKEVDVESNYESIYGCNIRGTGSNRDSLVSSDQQSNSLYGRWGEHSIYIGKASSDLSSSDRSDEWIDVTDTEEANNKPSSVIM